MDLITAYSKTTRAFPTMKSVKTGSGGRDGESETSDKSSDSSSLINSESENTDDENDYYKITIAQSKSDDVSSEELFKLLSGENIEEPKLIIEPLFEDFVDFETFQKSDFRAVKVLACEAVPKSKKLLKFTLDDGTGKERTILSGIHAFYEPEQLIGKTCIAIVNLPPRPMMGIESCGMLISAVHKEGEEEKLHLLQVDPHIPAGAKLY